jgi:hypothetical protein
MTKEELFERVEAIPELMSQVGPECSIVSTLNAIRYLYAIGNWQLPAGGSYEVFEKSFYKVLKQTDMNPDVYALRFDHFHKIKDEGRGILGLKYQFRKPPCPLRSRVIMLGQIGIRAEVSDSFYRIARHLEKGFPVLMGVYTRDGKAYTYDKEKKDFLAVDHVVPVNGLVPDAHHFAHAIVAVGIVKTDFLEKGVLILDPNHGSIRVWCFDELKSAFKGHDTQATLMGDPSDPAILEPGFNVMRLERNHRPWWPE